MAVALIVAAGSGERLGAGVPKALVQLAGRPLLQWSIDAIAAVPGVHQEHRHPRRVARYCTVSFSNSSA